MLGLTPAEAAGVIAALPAGREPTLPPAPGIGLPSSLLRRRPDVIVAERRLAAATAGVGVQIAEYFPKLNLLGSAGLQSDELNDLIDAGSRTWSFGGAIDWRLLDFARINAAVGLARAQVAEETANYKSSVVSAVRDVEDALVRLRAADEQTAALTTALNSRQSSVDQVERQYEAGLTQFLPVLTERPEPERRADGPGDGPPRPPASGGVALPGPRRRLARAGVVAEYLNRREPPAPPAVRLLPRPPAQPDGRGGLRRRAGRRSAMRRSGPRTPTCHSTPRCSTGPT